MASWGMPMPETGIGKLAFLLLKVYKKTDALLLIMIHNRASCICANPITTVLSFSITVL